MPAPESGWMKAVAVNELEATFLSLKSELELRPAWHRLRKRIERHLFTDVLAP